MALQQESNRQLIQQRLNLFRLPVVLIFLILAARLWQLQIIQGSEYALRAERNRIRTIQLVAPRGTIADRNNTPLVENRPSFNVVLYRECDEEPGEHRSGSSRRNLASRGKIWRRGCAAARIPASIIPSF